MKAKFFFPGLAAVLGVAIYLVLGAHGSNDGSFEDLGQHEEVDFSIEGAMDELAPEDRWMLRYIDPPAGVSPKDLYAFDCETVEIKPEALTIYCADFGIAVWKIKWAKWEASGAEGTGIFMANDCDPNCAEGKYLKVPVNLVLSDLVTNGKDYFFNTATIYPSQTENQDGPVVGKSGESYFTGSAIIKGKEISAEIWDIGSDFRTNPHLRMDLP